VHTDLSEKGTINSDKLQGKAKIVYLWKRYKRVASIAAVIAGITTITISLLVWSVTPKVTNSQYQDLSRVLESQKKDLADQKKITTRISEDIKTVKDAVDGNVKEKTPV